MKISNVSKILFLGDSDEPGGVRGVRILSRKGLVGEYLWWVPCELITKFYKEAGDTEGFVQAKAYLAEEWLSTVGLTSADEIRFEEV